MALLGRDHRRLSPTAAAAIELGEDLSAPTDTIAKYVWSADPASGSSRSAPPPWFTNVGRDTLIIIDEAGKAGTLELDAVITHALARGASIRLVGDDCQLASISAGGVLRNIAHKTDSLTLSQLVRFGSTAESAATLAIRRGDPLDSGFTSTTSVCTSVPIRPPPTWPTPRGPPTSTRAAIPSC